jgi:hypothetical protein
MSSEAGDTGDSPQQGIVDFLDSQAKYVFCHDYYQLLTLFDRQRGRSA